MIDREDTKTMNKIQQQEHEALMASLKDIKGRKEFLLTHQSLVESGLQAALDTLSTLDDPKMALGTLVFNSLFVGYSLRKIEEKEEQANG